MAKKRTSKSNPKHMTKSVHIDEIADSFFSMLKGLMFRKERVNILFVFRREGIHPIHSFFVLYEFDAVYLDNDFKVVEIFRNIRPFRTVSPSKPSMYLLEISHNRQKLNIGDKIVCKRNRND